jgi:hypothetical protein
MNSARQLSRDSNHDGITAPRTNHLRGMSLCDPQPRILARLDPELSATSCCPLAARRCCSASRGPTEIPVGRCCCHRYPGSRGGLRTRSALRCRDSGIRSSIALLTARLASSRPGSAGADSWSLPRARAHARAGPRKIVACLKVGADLDQNSMRTQARNWLPTIDAGKRRRDTLRRLRSWTRSISPQGA